MSNVLIFRGRTSFGPYARAEAEEFLAAGELSPDDAAWTEGLTDCEPLASVLPRLPAAPSPTAAPPVFTALELRDDTPPGVQGFSWGALFLTPIWSIGNRVWIGLLGFLPGLGLLVAIWLGFRGRTLAWRKGGWRSVAHFTQVQRRWSIATAIAWVLFIALAVVVLGAAIQRGAWSRQAPAAQGRDAPPADRGQDAPQPDRTPPAADGPRADAPPRQQPQPRPQPPQQQEPQPAQLQRPIPRDLLSERIRGANVAEVEAMLGPPVQQRRGTGNQRNLLAYAYTDLTIDPRTNQVDKLTLILFVNGIAQKQPVYRQDLSH